VRGAPSFSLTGEPVLADMFSPGEGGGITHIEEASRADLIVIAPATADTISRLACGRAGDLLGAVVLASTCPVLLAPGMNSVMCENPLVRQNMDRLLRLGRFHAVGPETGKLACGWEGSGKMAEPDEIFRFAEGILAGGGILGGKKIVVAAGPTVEDIDPVRFISNRSSGKMGYALARAARIRGAEVTLVSGPTELRPPSGVRVVSVRSAAEMQEAVLEAMKGSDVLFMAAAVADWKPRVMLGDKIRKAVAGDSLRLDLTATPDILASCARARRGRLPLIFGFSLETSAGKLVSAAKEKMKKKGCDVVVANLASESLEEDRTGVTVLDSKGKTTVLSRRSKDDIAHALLDMAAVMLKKQKCEVR
jgi:phosphopantothenoylcysteine decarboxylase/phosphopantothenate--cysteine ligase